MHAIRLFSLGKYTIKSHAPNDFMMTMVMYRPLLENYSGIFEIPIAYCIARKKKGHTIQK